MEINKHFISYKSFLVLILLTFNNINGQALLEADGPGNTYELINSVLAPAGNVVENPECVHPEFGRHITEVWDNELNKYIFEFHIHVAPDNDRCIAFDRQRLEIKTYDASPANLIGTKGETIIYKWKFRLPEGFQPSSKFTHIHQIKPVGGDDADPLFTLTPRKGTPDKLELIHNNSTKIKTADLSLFIGQWVECTETISVGTAGTYSMVIKKISDGTVLLSYSSNNIMTIRSNNNFIRPKWGIYRSLENASELRDESVKFNSFSIEEITTGINLNNSPLPLKPLLEQNYPNPFNPSTKISFSLPEKTFTRLKIFSSLWEEIKTLVNEVLESGYYTYDFNGSDNSSGIYFYRLEAEKFYETKKMLLIK